MKKLRNGSVYRSIFSVALIFAFALMPFGAFAASTLGTNMSTTGTFTQTVGSATAAQFQNAAGTVTSVIVDTTNNRVGVNTTNPATVFEVQGTASASYFFTINTIQAGGTFAAASVAYSRFGTGTTGHSLAAADDVLFTGLTEFNDNVFFDAKASMSSNFQMSGRFIADTAASHSFAGDLIITSALTVGATTASSSNGNGYTAEFVGPATGTSSFYFASSGVTATKGTCFQLKSTTGAWIYMSFPQGATAPVLDTTRCQ